MKLTFTVEVDTDNIIGVKEQIADALEDIGTVKFTKVEEGYQPCTKCKHFVGCEFGKQIFHKTTETPCDEFEREVQGE